MKTGLLFSLGILGWMLIAGVSLPGCTGNGNRLVVLSSDLPPKEADRIGTFLREFHEKYSMRMEGKNFTVEVPAGRIGLIKHYMTAPVDSVDYIRLIGTTRFAERDSARVIPKTAARTSGRLIKIAAQPVEHADSLKIGAAFDRIFEHAVWKCFRTSDYIIHVEFSGTIPETIRSNPEGMRIIGDLAGNRDRLLLDIGPEHSLWKFRWRVGIDGRSFIGESVKVIPGRFRPEEGKPPRETAYISL